MGKLERRLTETDRELLQDFDAKTAQLKQFCGLCVRGLQTGLLLFGSGGNGKSHTILESFAERGVKEITPEQRRVVEATDENERQVFGFDTYISHQGRVTPKGLIKECSFFPNSIHLVEDAEPFFADKNSTGVLRMLLWCQDQSPHPVRHPTWRVSTRDSYDFYFRGSLIFVGNRMLPKAVPEIDAIKTRCPSLTFDISNAELIARMKQICLTGYDPIPGAHLTPDECFDVLEFMLDAIEADPALKLETDGKEKRLNFRILLAGFRHKCFGKFEATAISWQDMLLSQLKEKVGAGKRTRAERVYDEGRIAKQLAATEFRSQDDKLAEYCRRTGRDTKWIDLPRDSAEYQKALRAAKKDFGRKNK